VGPLVPLKGGISSGVAAFSVTCNDVEERMVLRELGAWALKRIANAAEVEFKLLATLKQQGYPTSTPYYLAPPDAATPLLIVSYLPGSVYFTPADPQDYVTEMANALARIHALQADAFSFMPASAGEISHQIDWSPKRQKPVEDEPHIRGILKKSWPFDRQNPSVLLHGDFWPGNILWADDRLLAPIDWEDGGLGDPLLDIAVARQELAFAFDLEMADAFTEAYAAITKLDWSNMPLWDLYASLRPIDQFSLWASAWVDLGRPEITADTMRASRADIVARALKTIKT
jgi:aminoglycoside phosphotransferase (APT) family kinase protein